MCVAPEKDGNQTGTIGIPIAIQVVKPVHEAMSREATREESMRFILTVGDWRPRRFDLRQPRSGGLPRPLNSAPAELCPPLNYTGCWAILAG